MKKITEIFKANKYVIIWTAAYIAIVWAILLFMFNFNIFVGHQWQLLANAEIKGFAGFVFCILVLAALPMYIATTAVIMRTKQPLITINISPIVKIFNFIVPHPVPSVTPTDTEKQITTTDEQPPAPTVSDNEFPNVMPAELRGAFIRARQHIDQFTPPAFNATPNATATNTQDANATALQPGELPLPTDFDFDTAPDNDFTPDVAMPTFTDINFGDDNDANEDQPASEPTSENNDIINYLTQRGCTPRRDGDLIVANNLIIATHDDPDFWIADPETWFASGKQKPSPIVHLIKASAPQGLHPVLYLAQTNILELDACRAEWDKMGVTTITDLSELPL